MILRVRRPRHVWVSAVLALVATALPHALSAHPVVAHVSRPGLLANGAAWEVQAGIQSDTTVLVVYYSRSGNTQRMAEAVAEGVRGMDGARAVLKSVEEVTQQDLLDADALVLGSPTYYATIAGPMKSFIDDWGLRHHVDLADKVGGAFATGASRTGGKEHVVMSLLLAMMNNGMIIVGPLVERGGSRLGYPGATAFAPGPGEEISSAELDEARLLGARVARVAQRVGED